MIRVEQMFKDNPALKTFAEQSSKIPAKGAAISSYRTASIVTIPIVVHIVLNNPNVVTDADVQWQINKMNIDYSGLNADSTNIPPEFQALRGHSQIRFALARRTPSGALTTGIERIFSAAGSDASQTIDPVKRSSKGGADVWDPNSYFNIWVANDASGQGILGYAQFPGAGDPADDGIVINVRAWGNNPCYTLASYNLGRTAVHETGHYLGLFHIWGDDGTACTGDDFKSLTTAGSTCNLPLGLYNPTGQGNTASDIGDTPNQAGSNAGLCPSGIKTDACTTTAPGIMYQDFMDYTDDPCYSMFTKKQVERMEWVLDNCRASLKTSPGATIPAGAIILDAAPVQAINPGGIDINNCVSTFFPSTLPCPGSIVPKIRIRNNGLTTINTVTVGLTVNGGAPAIINLSTALPFGYSTVVSFPSLNVTTGTYTLKFFTANPNGVQPDQVPSNDTLTVTLTVTAPVPLPISEGFENSTFPPPGWSIFNPNGDKTWERVSPGHNSNFSAKIDNYNTDATGRIDDIRTPEIIFSKTDSIIISFDVAHKNYPDPDYYDTLSVLVSSDCGNTFTTVYKKYGPELATADTSSEDYTAPAQSDWRRERVAVGGAVISSGNIIVAFRNTNRFGNNIFLDNINIDSLGPGDLRLVSINQPDGIICNPSVTPTVTVQNSGSQPVADFTVTYIVDNGPSFTTNFTAVNLPPGQQLTVTLNPPFTAAVGVHTIKAYVSNLLTSGGAKDLNPSNDTLAKVFTLVGKVSIPISEGFESPTFPPVNWGVDNPDGSITWERTTAAAKTGIASMVIRNYDYTTTKTIDRFASPVLTSFANYDSLFVSFDLAYALGNGSAPDTLEIDVTRDCGQTFTTVWKAWGAALQTASSNGFAFIPTAADWRNIKILLSPFITGPTMQVYFVAKSNKQNNLYIDNINIYGVTLPKLLKAQGYEIYPNPFRNIFNIQFLRPPVDLQSIEIYNAQGQRVWVLNTNGSSNTLVPVDLSKFSAGVYLVKLNYTYQTIFKRVVKN